MRLNHVFTKGTTPQSKLGEHLIDEVKAGDFDPVTVATLAAAAAWSYADIRTFTDRLSRLGLRGECLEIGIKNDALLVDTTAYLFIGEKSEAEKSMKFAILALRGTMPTNVINWMSDVSTRQVEFMYGGGMVHGGIYLSAMSIWTTLREFLAAAYVNGVKQRYDQFTKAEEQNLPNDQQLDPVPNERVLEALYITGHSLGAALAALAAAAIHVDPKMEFMRKLVRVVCAFGPPMFIDPTLAGNFNKKFGDKYFWFKYQHDVVPALPGVLFGDFSHFGQQYVTSDTERVWVRGRKPVRRAISSLAANGIGILAWVKNSLPWLRNTTLPFSWDDHSPGHYLRASLRTYPYTEFL
jgi:hypothetical protein